MRAAILDAIGSALSVQDIDIEGPRAGEALIRVKACGVCHSDYSCMHGILKAPVPSVLGHEMAGIVEAVGPGVENVKKGDHVVAGPTPHCGVCEFCVESRPYLCTQMAPMFINATMLDGTSRLSRRGEIVYQLCGIAGFAEQAVVPAGALVKVDRGVPLEAVCVLGCGVMTGVGAVMNTAKVERGTTVAVLGCGGVGLAVIQAARIAGARQIIAVDPVASRRALAVRLGATDEVDPSGGDVVKQVKKLSGGGVHYGFECIGRTDTISQVFNMVRPSGTAVAVGAPKITDEVGIRASGFLQDKSLKGSLYGASSPRRDIPRMIEWYRSGDLRLDEIVTHQIPLADINDAFALMTSGGGARAVVMMD